MNNTIKSTLMAISVITSNPILASSDPGGSVSSTVNSHVNLLSLNQHNRDDMSTPESGDETPPVASGTSAAERASDQVSTYPVIKTEEMIRLLNGEDVFPHLRIYFENSTQTNKDKTDYSDANIIKGLENGTLIISRPHIHPITGSAMYAIETIFNENERQYVLYIQLHAY